MSINLHIERLILDGLPTSDAQGSLIGAALETELTRLLATGGLESNLQSGGAWPSIPVSTVQLTANMPTQLGHQIAQAVYGGIGQEQSLTARPNEGSTHNQTKVRPLT